MSVTFTTDDVKYEEGKTDEYGFSLLKEGYYELNLCNTNAADLLRLLELEADARNLYGTWPAAQLPSIRAKLVKLKNMEYEKPTVQYGNMIEIGRSSEYAARRLNQMLNLIDGAIERNVHVVFS